MCKDKHVYVHAALYYSKYLPSNTISLHTLGPLATLAWVHTKGPP